MQRGSIRQNGNHWLLKYRVKVVKDGKQFWKDEYHKLAPVGRQHQTKESVQSLADVFLATINVGTSLPQSGDQLGTYLDNFLKQGIGGRGNPLNPTTLKSYRDMYKLALPYIDGLELRKVRTPDINRIFDQVRHNAGPNGRAHTVYRNLKHFLNSALKRAIGQGLIEYNPVRDSVSISGNPIDTHKTTLQETKAIVKALSKGTTKSAVVAKNAVMIATFTGLRMEEILGLKWEDYDGNVLDIKRAVVHGKILETKTLHSKAPIPVVGLIKKTLKEHRAVNSGRGFMFHDGEGKQLYGFGNLVRDIRPILEQEKVQWYGWHGFRRGLNVQLKKLEVDFETRQNILRHAPEGVTDRHYSEPNIEQMRGALEKVEAVYKRLK